MLPPRRSGFTLLCSTLNDLLKLVHPRRRITTWRGCSVTLLGDVSGF